MHRSVHRIARSGGPRGEFGTSRPRADRRQHRRDRARCFAITTAAAGASLVPFFASTSNAQTWVNPNTGLWSVGANWVGGAPPVSGAATQLRFNATGSESYTASNDLIAPFLLNSITFDNDGSGLIALNQNTIAFGGANPAIVQAGPSTISIANQLQLNANTSVTAAGGGTVLILGPVISVPAATGTSGSSLIVNNAVVDLRGGTTGGNLYSLRIDSGFTYIQGGAYTLASTQRGVDQFDNINDGGNWGLVVGNTNAVATHLNMTAGSITGQNAMVADTLGSIGIATFSNPGTTATFTGTQGRFGTNRGTGTISILNGATVSARRGDIIRNTGGTGFLRVDGAGSRFTATQELNVPLSSGNATLSVSNGGTVQLTNADFFLASAIDPSFNAVSSNASATVTGAGSGITATGDGISSGVMLVGFGATGVPANGTLNINAGGVVNAAGAFVGRSAGTATVELSGPGSQLNNSFQAVVSSTTASRVNVSNGAVWTNTGDSFTAVNSTDRAIINVSGTNSRANLSGSVVVSSSGSSTINISAGGEFRAGNLYAADNANSQASISATGANSKLTIINQALISDGTDANASVTISDGANMNVGSATFLSAPVGAISNVSINGPGSSYTSTAPAVALHIGGDGLAAGGTASFSVDDGATANATGPAIVYTRGTLRIGGGSIGTAGAFTSASTVVNGTVNYNAGTFNTAGTLSVGGQILLGPASRDPNGVVHNKKVLESGQLVMTGSALIDLNDNDALFHNSSLATVQSRIAAARNGGQWNQPGITSTAARDRLQQNTSLGAISGSDYLTANPGGTFNGRPVVGSDVVVKYTYYGDTDLNGAVNFDDYARTDSGFNNARTGWFNGDFDYNGVVNFDDYSLLDLAFNTQSAVLQIGTVGDGVIADLGDRHIIEAPLPMGLSHAGVAPAAIDPQARGSGQLNAVPEPAFIGTAGIALSLTLTARRRRRRLAR